MSDPVHDDALWQPSPERVAASEMERFRLTVRPDSDDTTDLWRWSVDEPGPFWRAVWTWCGVVGDPGERDVATGATFAGTRFLPDARLNVAENLLADRAGAGPEAIVWRREDGAGRTVTWDQLRAEVAAVAGRLAEAGVTAGDRVAAWMPHVPETIVTFLAAASLGAVFTSTSADFGVDGVVDRFGQSTPKVLVAADGYHYGGRTFDCLDRLGEIRSRLPSVTTTLVVGHLERRPELTGDLDDPGVERWSDALDRHRGAELRFESLTTDHPLYILYSSGTTGRPKCIVHRAGGVLLKHLSEQRFHTDIRPGDRVLFFTTCGWMMWNWLVSALGSGATVVAYDGNPSFPRPDALVTVADELGVTMLGMSAKYIDGLMKSGVRPRDETGLHHLRTISSTGSPLSPEGFVWVHDAVAPDIHLASISGGTDLCGCLVGGDPTRPVYAGEIQGPCLGMAIDVYDHEGRPVARGHKGELVCTRPFPSMPLGFWGDDDGSRYRAAYFERFDGVWAHGDFASWTDHGGMVIHGRSDATLNASGVRIGTAEIYRVVEQIDEVAEAIAIGQEWDGDTRIVLFVRLVEPGTLADDLVARIRSDVRNKCSPRHMPAVVAEVPDIPRTRSGKIVELAVSDVVHGRPVLNLEALANPDALDHFAGRSELT
ncbi:MAG: acetoacetate--CoA ligase [Acidimicrobiales bacterium]